MAGVSVAGCHRRQDRVRSRDRRCRGGAATGRRGLWDTSAVATLDAVVAKFAARGVNATITGLTHHSAELHQRLSGQLPTAH